MADPQLERLAEAHRRARDAANRLSALAGGLRKLATQVDATIAGTATGADRTMTALLVDARAASDRAAQSADAAARLALEAVARAQQEQRTRTSSGRRR